MPFLRAGGFLVAIGVVSALRSGARPDLKGKEWTKYADGMCKIYRGQAKDHPTQGSTSQTDAWYNQFTGDEKLAKRWAACLDYVADKPEITMIVRNTHAVYCMYFTSFDDCDQGNDINDFRDVGTWETWELTDTKADEDTKAAGDPHCRNVKGEAFDVRAVGSLSMVRVPRAAAVEDAGFAVTAHATAASWKPCAPTWIDMVEIRGRLLGCAGIQVHVGKDGVPALEGDAPQLCSGAVISRNEVAKSELNVTVGPYSVSLKQQSTWHDFAYFDMDVMGLVNSGEEVGGLLGLDSHEAEVKVPSECQGPAMRSMGNPGAGDEGKAGARLASWVRAL